MKKDVSYHVMWVKEIVFEQLVSVWNKREIYCENLNMIHGVHPHWGQFDAEKPPFPYLSKFPQALFQRLPYPRGEHHIARLKKYFQILLFFFECIGKKLTA